MKWNRATQHTHLDPLNCTLHRPVTWSTSVTLPSLVRRVPFMALRTATPRMSSAGKRTLLRHKVLLWHNVAQPSAFHSLGMIGAMQSALQEVGMVGVMLSSPHVDTVRPRHPSRQPAALTGQPAHRHLTISMHQRKLGAGSARTLGARKCANQVVCHACSCLRGHRSALESAQEHIEGLICHVQALTVPKLSH